MHFVRYSQKNYQQVLEFLTRHEAYCVSLVTEFFQQSSQFFLLLDKEEKIIGIFDLSAGGTIRHCLPVSDKESIVRCGILFVEFFKKHNDIKLFSISGETTGTQIIRRAASVVLKTPEKHSQDYLLMENNSSRSGEPLPEPGVEIVECDLKDAKSLFPLQKAYELEEVYYDRKLFKSSVCLFNLEHSLKKNYICGLKFDGRIIAKAGTNGEGKNYVQLGGVFTLKEFRGHGFARKLMEHMLNHFSGIGKKCVLFVKDSNLAAKKLYEKLDFSEICKYQIVYYH